MVKFHRLYAPGLVAYVARLGGHRAYVSRLESQPGPWTVSLDGKAAPGYPEFATGREARALARQLLANAS